MNAILSRLTSFSFAVSFFRHGGQLLAGEPFLDEASQEISEGNDILADARFFESLHVDLAVPDGHHARPLARIGAVLTGFVEEVDTAPPVVFSSWFRIE
jgi:hypothetical protein